MATAFVEVARWVVTLVLMGWSLILALEFAVDMWMRRFLMARSE